MLTGLVQRVLFRAHDPHRALVIESVRHGVGVAAVVRMERPDVLFFSAAPEGAKPGLPIAVIARLLAQELEVLPAQLVADVPVDQVADVVEPGVIDYVHRLREVRELASERTVLRRHRVPPLPSSPVRLQPPVAAGTRWQRGSGPMT